MIVTPADLRRIRPIAENLNDNQRLVPYIQQTEELRLIDAIGAHLYRWLDETDFTQEGPFEYTRKDGQVITISKEDHTEILYGGYYSCINDCEKDGKSLGLTSAIAYIAYSYFINENPVNITAFGVVRKNGEYSTALDQNSITAASNTARKTGEAMLSKSIAQLKYFGLIGSCKKYKETPNNRMLRIKQHKL